MFRLSGRAAALVGGCVLTVATPIAAQDAPQSVDLTAPVARDAFDGTPVSEDALGKVTGRENMGAQIAQANQRNTVSNNSVVGTSVTGNIVIDGNAFQNLQGLAVINANSGNNVAINSAMNVTINLQPMP